MTLKYPNRLLPILFLSFLIPLAFTSLSQNAAAAASNVFVQPVLAAHKALYDVKLTSSKNGSQIVNIRGKMYYEWKPSCDGWITNHRFTLNYEYADAAPLNIASDFTTFESYDGKVLNFSSRRKRDSDVYEQLRGKAILDDNHRGEAVYSMPADLKFNLPSPTFFPTGHTLALLDAARKGTKFLNVKVFDGSDDEGPVDINAFIGVKDGEIKSLGRSGEIKNDNIKQASNNHIDQSLLNNSAWKIRMAFFPGAQKSPDNPDSSSDYELSMMFHENGVISDMVIDYADFSIEQKLVALEKVKPEACKAE